MQQNFYQSQNITFVSRFCAMNFMELYVWTRIHEFMKILQAKFTRDFMMNFMYKYTLSYKLLKLKIQQINANDVNR